MLLVTNSQVIDGNFVINDEFIQHLLIENSENIINVHDWDHFNENLLESSNASPTNNPQHITNQCELFCLLHI